MAPEKLTREGNVVTYFELWKPEESWQKALNVV